MALVSPCKTRPFGTWSLCDVLILVTEEWEASLIPLVLGHQLLERKVSAWLLSSRAEHTAVSMLRHWPLLSLLHC